MIYVANNIIIITVSVNCDCIKVCDHVYHIGHPAMTIGLKEPLTKI